MISRRAGFSASAELLVFDEQHPRRIRQHYLTGILIAQLILRRKTSISQNIVLGQ